MPERGEPCPVRRLPDERRHGDTGSVLCRHVGESGRRSQRPRAPRAGGPPTPSSHTWILDLVFSELWQKGLVLFLATQACRATQWSAGSPGLLQA